MIKELYFRVRRCGPFVRPCRKAFTRWQNDGKPTVVNFNKYVKEFEPIYGIDEILKAQIHKLAKNK